MDQSNGRVSSVTQEPINPVEPMNRNSDSRVQQLLAAVMTVGGDLELEVVLDRITKTAVELVDCKYAALGVLGQDYHARPADTKDAALVEFVTTGISGEQREGMGRPPHGDGILGLLVRDPRPIRLDDLAAHPASVGFPANHPPMRSFLGVPVRVRGRVFGNLYLTEKVAGSFTQADEDLVITLATAAGVAIENARLYGDARRAEERERARAEISRALLADEDSSEVLALVAKWARRISQADVAAIGFEDEHGTQVIEVADGARASELLGTPLPLPEPSLLVPLGRRKPSAALCVANARDGHRFDHVVISQLKAFADQAVIALELAEARHDAERIGIFEDRDRIARDLHDSVIQRIFAAGLALEAVSRQISDEQVTAKIHSISDDLDLTIRDIRSTIYSLQTLQRDGSMSLRARVIGLTDQLSSVLGFSVKVRIDGLIDAGMPAAAEDDLIAVVRESLTNVAKHAGATRAELVVENDGTQMRVYVHDDGCGIPIDSVDDSEQMAGHGRDGGLGLGNLTTRAQAHGGSFTIESAVDRYDTAESWTQAGWVTRLSWTIPLTERRS
jgi:signal transduction histidine kinase